MSNIWASAPDGIIFDLDGTLLDTEPLYTQATQQLLDPYGHTYSMALKKQCMGGDSRRSAQMTIDEYGLPMSIEEYLSSRDDYLAELFPTSPEISGATELLAALLRVEIPIGLATSSHHHLCEIKLSNQSWKSAFTSIICGDDASVAKGKPEPDIFLACAALLGLPAENCIVFEDSPTGIKAAKAAGMRVVAINSPYVELEDLGEADMIIDSFHEILPLMEAW
jgi:pseudouridine-5'-monophosphatase